VSTLTTVLAIVGLGALVVGGNGLWLLSIRYAAERTKATAPDGGTFDVLVHRDGVMLYTGKAAAVNLYGILPTLVAALRRWRRGPWRWAVTVRQSPFAGYKDLLHERFDEPDAARRSATELIQLIADGQRLWLAEREW
jgi:hypothetical protein